MLELCMRVIQYEDGTFIYASTQNCKIGFDYISYRYTHIKYLAMEIKKRC